MKNLIIAIVTLVLLLGVVKWHTRPDNGVDGLDKNVSLIEGECIVINWGASPREVELALEKWWELRNKRG